MRRVFTGIAFLMLFASTLIAQTGNGSIGGIVQDPSKALLPGVSLTLTNTATGVVNTQISNEAGAYQFQAIPPGTYNVTAQLPSFKQAVASGVLVGANAQIRRDFTLEIGALTSQVEVFVAADQLLTEASASIGVVLPQQKVTELPMVGQNILSLLTVLPGFRTQIGANGLDAGSTVGGLNLDYVNTTINGLSTVSSRDSASFWGREVLTTNVINPDLVGEIRLILSPVDVELGRGNSQIQISTRSGTNKYNGAAVWNVQNSALNAYTWSTKRVHATAQQPEPVRPDWYNLNQITVSYGGPILRNKTFFFALYDKQMVNRRSLVTTPVLTDTARQGIWRYFEGWNPAPAGTAEPTSFVAPGVQPTGTAAAVNFDGSPLRPNFNPTGGAYTLGGLRCFSIFGNKKVSATGLVDVNPATDCPGGTFVNNGSPWDSKRTTVDSTGYILNILSMMPRANFFASNLFGGANGTDGLNNATYRWVQGRRGSSGTNATIGVSGGPADLNERDQINLKIDHNITSNHRVAVSWTYEKSSGEAALSTWGTGLNGNTSRRPQFVTVNATSTLSSSLVNEARFGLNYSSEFASPAWANIDHTDIRDDAQKFILYGNTNPTNNRKYPVLYNPGANWNGYMSFTSFDFANYSPLYNYADTIRWTKGKHAFSFGGEYRRPSTVGYNNSGYANSNPGNGGTETFSASFFIASNLNNGSAQLPGLLATTRGNVGALLNTMYGAINLPNTTYWIDGQKDVKAGTWQDVTTIENRFKSNDPYGHQTRGQIQNEWSFFAKDDFKINSRLTLNFGVRYDFAGSPYLTEGLTNTLLDEGIGLFGPSRARSANPFDTWLTPGDLYLTGYGSTTADPLKCAQGVANPGGIPASNCDPNLLSKVIFVGPGTDNPEKSLIPERGMFSPAIGFSWQLPWFGDGKTTLRGGFQRTYGKPGAPFTGGLLSGPGASDPGGNDSVLNSAPIQSILATRALNLADLPLAVPNPPTNKKPADRVFRIGSRSGSIGAYSLYDPNYKIPYNDNWTLTLQRSLSRSLTLEVRAVNTLARDQAGTAGSFGTAGTFDINTVNVYHNPELFNALEVTRAGGNSPLFDQMLMGLNVANQAGYGPVGTTVGGVLQRGSAHLRRSTTFATNLANGNYVGVMNSLLGLNPTGAQALPIDPNTGLTLATSQRALRNGCDRIANGLTTGFTDPSTGAAIGPRCFPENYVTANSQWGGNVLYATNLGYSNYNSFETTITMRPVHGLSLQATYGFSKQMTQPGSGFTDPKNPKRDFGMSVNSVGNDFRANGTFELPIGPNKLLLGNSAGWLARAVERWNMAFIYNVSEGARRTFSAGNGLTGQQNVIYNMMYANARPNIVGPWDNPEGSVRWNGQNGRFFDDSYITYADPQCANVGTADNLRASCNLRGLAKVTSHLEPGAVLINPATNTYGIPLLENPTPGNQGNLGAATLKSFPRWSLDGNLSKTFQIRESVSAQLRIDATNILNHPLPNEPTGLTGGGFNDNFGQITGKGNQVRNFQAKLRITF